MKTGEPNQKERNKRNTIRINQAM